MAHSACKTPVIFYTLYIKNKRIHSDDFRGHGSLGCIDQTVSAQVICPDSQILINVANCLPGKMKEQVSALNLRKKKKLNTVQM